MEPKLLTRDQFRESVFARDGHKCVFCGKRAEDTPEGKLDAHHIQIEGGRYGRWVDLEAIQMITDPFIPSRVFEDKDNYNCRMFPPAIFTIQFAFQDKVVQISSAGQAGDPDVEKHIEELIEQHALLLAAWKNL